MGLFDTLECLDSDPRFCDARGLRLGELQTKDFGDPSMVRYFVSGQELYSLPRNGGQQHTLEEVTLAGGEPHLSTRRRLARERLTRTVRAYTYADWGLPVLTVNPKRTFSWDMVEDNFPFVELDVAFVDGRVHAVGVVSNPTREELRAQLKAEGKDVLDDSDPIAVRHLALRGTR